MKFVKMTAQLMYIFPLALIYGCSSQVECGSSTAKSDVAEIIKQNNMHANLYSELFMEKYIPDVARLETEYKKNMQLIEQKISEVQRKQHEFYAQCMTEIQNSNEFKDVEREIRERTVVFINGTPLYNESSLSKQEALRSVVGYMDNICRGDNENALNNIRVSELMNIRGFEQLHNKSTAYAKQKLSVPELNAASLYKEQRDLKTKYEKDNEAILEKHTLDGNEVVKNASIRLNDIVTTGKSKDTGSQRCRANVRIAFGKVESNAVVEYMVEKADGGKAYTSITGFAAR